MKTKYETEADLHDEYARVIRMCEGTKVAPKVCWKCDGIAKGTQPAFTSAPSDYTFALAIVYDDVRKIDRPVFEGDVLYGANGNRIIASADVNFDYKWSWNPPKKKTFMLNGKELPLPDGGDTFRISFPHSWKSQKDAMKVEDAINKLLSGASQ